MIVSADRRIVRADLVRRLLALRAFHQLDHSIQEALPRVRGDQDLDPVRQDARSPRDGAAVAARLADHGCGFPVMADSSTEATPSITDPSPGMISPAFTITTSSFLSCSAGTVSGEPSFRSRFAIVWVRVLRSASACAFSPPLGHRLGEVGEQHGEPQPYGHLQTEPQRLVRRPEEERDGREERPHFGDEHHGVFSPATAGATWKTDATAALPEDFRFEQGMCFYRHGGFPL